MGDDIPLQQFEGGDDPTALSEENKVAVCFF
jgi:hypothetical protein